MDQSSSSASASQGSGDVNSKLLPAKEMSQKPLQDVSSTSNHQHIKSPSMSSARNPQTVVSEVGRVLLTTSLVGNDRGITAARNHFERLAEMNKHKAISKGEECDIKMKTTAIKQPSPAPAATTHVPSSSSKSSSQTTSSKKQSQAVQQALIGNRKRDISLDNRLLQAISAAATTPSSSSSSSSSSQSAKAISIKPQNSTKVTNSSLKQSQHENQYLKKQILKETEEMLTLAGDDNSLLRKKLFELLVMNKTLKLTQQQLGTEDKNNKNDSINQKASGLSSASSSSSSPSQASQRNNVNAQAVHAPLMRWRNPLEADYDSDSTSVASVNNNGIYSRHYLVDDEFDEYQKDFFHIKESISSSSKPVSTIQQLGSKNSDNNSSNKNKNDSRKQGSISSQNTQTLEETAAKGKALLFDRRVRRHGAKIITKNGNSESQVFLLKQIKEAVSGLLNMESVVADPKPRSELIRALTALDLVFPPNHQGDR